MNIQNPNKVLPSSYSWDQYFMTMAYLVSMKSKDLSTRVGAIIVNADNQIISTGYNGLPKKIQDIKNRYENKDYKYLASNHAEENAILQCAKIGVSSKKCTIYTPWLPCALCAKMIIQSGIIRVVYDACFPGNKEAEMRNWRESIEISKEMLSESSIELVAFEDKLIEIQVLYNGINETRRKP